jgi:hypothetical protein
LTKNVHRGDYDLNRAILKLVSENEVKTKEIEATAPR